MAGKITFFPDVWYTPDHNVVNNYVQAKRRMDTAIEKDGDLSTTQMSLLMDPLIWEFRVINIVDGTGTCSIVKRPDGWWDCKRTSREIRPGLDLYRLWVGGEFDI